MDKLESRMLKFGVLDPPILGVGKQFLILGECWAIANIAHYLEKVENILSPGGYAPKCV